jgi:hypothetical protein
LASAASANIAGAEATPKFMTEEKKSANTAVEFSRPLI